MLLRSLVLGLASFAVVGLANADPIATAASPNADQEITRQVELLIEQHSDLGTLLTVHTKNRIVYLGGTATTPLTMANAASLIGQIHGVQGVVDVAGIEE
jgi:osmotically-inducible protein OsmY